MVDTYGRALGGVFDGRTPSFSTCAEHGYLAMGCDGMRHRGPTVRAMFLSYSGCAPEHAVAIVDNIWGTDGIEPQMRIALESWAASLGAQPEHAEAAAKLRALLGQP